MKHLLLVRHGQSKWNRQHRIQGQSGAGLTELGVKQARRTAAWLADRAGDAQLISSDLQRCVQTAEAIGARLGVDPELTEGLRERDFGAWTGELAEEVREREPDRYARWRAGGDVIPEVGGESTAVLEQRVLGVLEQLLARLDPGGSFVVVTHGGPVWHGTRAFVDLREDGLTGVANASLTELVAPDDPAGASVDAGWGRRLRSYNQVAHLPADLRD